jgi:hypothetical protein
MLLQFSFCPLEGDGVKLKNEVCEIDFGYSWYLIITYVVILTIIIIASYANIYLKVMKYTNIIFNETLLEVITLQVTASGSL